MKQKLIALFTAVKHFLKRLKSFLPRSLPRTRAEYITFMNDVCIPFGLPVSVNSNFAVSTMLMHLDATCTRKPIRYFVNAIKKLQVNEVAYDVLDEARKAQKPVATTAPVPNATIPQA